MVPVKLNLCLLLKFLRPPEAKWIRQMLKKTKEVEDLAFILLLIF